MRVSAIDVSDLTVHYGRRVAVDSVSLRVDAREIVAVLGPNGAGKSTLLAAIAGALPATAGTIRIAGVDPAQRPLDARRATGFCDQPPTLYEFLTVEEHVTFVARARGAEDAAAVTAVLADLGLAGVSQRLCRELSFGMRQRVGLAAALIGAVRVVLLDETLNGLDPRASVRARASVQRAAEAGAAVVMSTHLLGVAERLCSRIVIMDRGRIRADVAAHGLDAAAVEELYMQHVRDEDAA
ncbi:MAG: ABC transporter ATP-binding protein [Deltaproteobacteria bacterium]|nr:MAG: ABC transporter ATP-binding protein [Deltaproteobacteria bacterium]